MDPRLQEMLDHYEIRKTLARYCHGCDRCDEPRMASVYVEDSWDDHGHRRAPGPEYARLMAGEVLATTDSMYHLLGQSQIEVNGDAAGAETYFIAVSNTTREDGVSMCNQLGGRFVDELVRQGDGWLIKHRTVMRDWGISLPVEQDWTAHAGLRPGERSQSDPSFATLNLIHGGVRSAEGLRWR
jgi:hypothetical protein